MRILFFLLASTLILSSGCSIVRSSFNYTQGTECLERGEYSAAIDYLTKAVELDPSTSKNQNNLAAAYAAVGDLDQAWYHSRQAVLCPDDNPTAVMAFWSLYYNYVSCRGLDQNGVSIDDVLNKLGHPDVMVKNSDGTMISMEYGLAVIEFKNGTLINVKK